MTVRSRLSRLAPALLALALMSTACGDEETTTKLPSQEPDRWSVAFLELPGALLSVWGTSASNVWSVGADPGDGGGPMVMHYDGATWTRLETGATGDLWWVTGFAGGPLFMGGAGGLALRYEDGAFTKLETPGTGTVFGLWGADEEHVWAVGGAGQTASGGFVWRWDGAAWTDEASLPQAIRDGATLFKVWGRSSTDLRIVGSGGRVLDFDGQAFTERVSPAGGETLFTVSGNDDRAIAVGGSIIAEQAGDGEWKDVGLAGAPRLNGVTVRGEEAYAVGVTGAVLKREIAGWSEVATGLEVYNDLHGSWIDPGGGVWAVGGQVAAYPLIMGTLIHHGQPISTGTYVGR